MNPVDIPNGEEMQRIRDSDAMAGDDLQTAPTAWQQRRRLLAYIERHQTRWERLEQVATMTYQLCRGQGDSQEIQSRIVRVIRQLFCDHGNHSDSCTHPDCNTGA